MTVQRIYKKAEAFSGKVSAFFRVCQPVIKNAGHIVILISSFHYRRSETHSPVNFLDDNNRKTDNQIYSGEDSCKATHNHDDKHSDIHIYVPLFIQTY